MDKELITHGYDEVADRYLEIRPGFDNSQYLEMVGGLLRPNSRVLDLGCGAGVPAGRMLADMGHEVHGIDISSRQIELAQQHVPTGSFEVRDMNSLEDGEYSVDAIVSLYAIYHTPRETHPELFRKLYSFLPEGGVMFALLGAKDWEGTKNSFYGVQMSWSMYGPEANRQMIEEAGFTIELDEIDTTGDERHQAILARK